ncbi:unnamed protein product [Pseudo-nitzschia multistriata]|uniref:TLDc domain-containing protein n=1 Tax=Pseudo-nitzschia multistriata TaxID=183589 RepID=A0A448Z9B5_9STRA|nr:unnamed protein product [Pseudo-nitzschia multistriata]
MGNCPQLHHCSFGFGCWDCSSSSKRMSDTNHYRRWHENKQQQQRVPSACYGWFENLFEPSKSSESSESARQLQYPEQYPATYELNILYVEEDANIPEAKLVRPLLKNTQLQSRALQLVYDANRDGWNPTAFHSAVDGKGASVIITTDENGRVCGGYNPKGQSSLGGARPSVAAFLFYERRSKKNEEEPTRFQKLRKVGGGGLACARDDPDFGISFGPDSLVIGLQAGREMVAQSKLGSYYERGPEDLPSLFWQTGGATELIDLKVLVGCYDDDEDIPYSGGVLDMTSG